MTKNQFSDLILLNLGIQNQDAREAFDKRVIWRLGDIVRGRLIEDYVKRTQNKGEFTKGIVLPVLQDVVRNRPYTIIGGFILNISNNDGLVSVSRVQDETNPFALVNAGQIGIYQNLEASQIGITYWQEGERLYYNNLGFEINNVLVIGIPTIAALEEDENIPIPYGLENDWFDMVKQKSLPQLSEDKANDTRQSPV